MPGRLEPRRWLQLHRRVYAVAQSNDGQYVAVGTETGASVFTLGGHCLATYPVDGGELPIHQVRADSDFSRLVLATRSGDAVLLDLKLVDGTFDFEERKLYFTANDIHTLSFSNNEERVAVGHLSFALSMVALDGDLVWQQRDEGAAALGTTWSVALDPEGNKLYAGSAGSGTNWLLRLDAATGTGPVRYEMSAPVTGVAVLPDNAGVAIVSPGEYYSSSLQVYAPDLSDLLWEHEFDGPATALAADSVEPVVAVGAGYEGTLALFDAANGSMLASEPLRAMVNSLSIVRGRFVAAATQDGDVALMRYIP